MSRKTTLTGKWLALAVNAGGLPELAEALGVNPATIWKWHRGDTMSRLYKKMVREYATRRHLADPTEDNPVGNR
jgi:hypothetical protein